MITKWANIEDDGAPHALLRRVAGHVPVDAIDTLWVFPTRRSAGIESTVLVLSAFDTDDADRRRVGAIRFLVTRDRKGKAAVEEHVFEYARAPAGAIQRVVDGVMRRLGDDASEPPRAHTIDGDADRWRALLRELGGSDAADDADDAGDAAHTVGAARAGDAAHIDDAAHAARADDPIAAAAADIEGAAITAPDPDATDTTEPAEDGDQASAARATANP
jgi:hypothetical protein